MPNANKIARLFKLYFVDNRKTTLVGASLIATGLSTAVAAFPFRRESVELLITAVSTALGGVGLILSKDAKHVDEAPTSANPAQVPPGTDSSTLPGPQSGANIL